MKRGESGLAFIVGVKKPCGMTSHDVVARVRRALGERRVGHAGTLDPAASGVLVVGVGQGTRLMGQLTLDDKCYIARIRFGSSTDTDDAEGAVLEKAAVPERFSDDGFAKEAVAGLVGTQMQTPPAYSAISVDGKRAYALARSGVDVKLDAREITVYDASLLAVDADDGVAWTCAFTVSKGTYIRALARDLGAKLGVPAHLEALERISVGPVTLALCISLDELSELGVEGVSERILDPLALMNLPARILSDEELSRSVTGTSLSSGGRAEGSRFGLVHGNRLMGIWYVKHGELVCESNFPGGIAGVRL